MRANSQLTQPTALLLPRVADRKGWIHLDRCKVSRDDYGVLATVDSSNGSQRIYLPVATLHALILGPGTSITVPSLATLADSGCTVIATGAGASRYYSSFTPRSGSTRLLQRQITINADHNARLQAARHLYELRFGSTPIPIEELSLEKLRGLEGARVRALYKTLAQQHRVTRFKRSYDPHDFDTGTPINQALSSANACLYGVVLTALHSLGCSPAIGIIHEGHPRAFAHDIADLYKAEFTVPLAFALANHHDPAGEARRRLAHDARLLKLAPRIVHDINTVLGGTHETYPAQSQPEELWDPAGNVPNGTAYTVEEW